MLVVIVGDWSMVFGSLPEDHIKKWRRGRERDHRREGREGRRREKARERETYLDCSTPLMGLDGKWKGGKSVNVERRRGPIGHIQKRKCINYYWVLVLLYTNTP